MSKTMSEAGAPSCIGRASASSVPEAVGRKGPLST